jgi:hypothetical protein
MPPTQQEAVDFVLEASVPVTALRVEVSNGRLEAIRAMGAGSRAWAVTVSAGQGLTTVRVVGSAMAAGLPVASNSVTVLHDLNAPQVGTSMIAWSYLACRIGHLVPI